MDFESAYVRSLPWERHGESGRLMLPRARARGLWEAARSASFLEGEFWECGVYKGGSASLIIDAMEDRPHTLRLFDTFRGFANVSGVDSGPAYEGCMFYSESAIEDIKQFLVRYESIYFHPGSIPSGFAGLEGSNIAFANVDVDLYKPTREALSFILPRMVKGGIIVLDDYNDPDWPGVSLAVNELGVGFNFVSSGTQAILQV